MVHLILHVLTLTVSDRILKFILLTYIPEVDHPVTYYASGLHTADYEDDLLTNVNNESD